MRVLIVAPGSMGDVAPFPLRRLTADKLAALLRTAVNDDRYRQRAAELAATLWAEDGAGQVVSALGHLV